MKRTAIVGLALLVACGESTAPPGDTFAITTINGGAVPLLVRNTDMVVAGFGFGSSQGSSTLRISTSDGESDLEVSSWSNQFIMATVPPNAVTGTVTLVHESTGTLQIPVGVREQRTTRDEHLTWEDAGSIFPRPVRGGAATSVNVNRAGDLVTVVAHTGGISPTGDQPRELLLGEVTGTGTVTRWFSGDSLLPNVISYHTMAGVSAFDSELDETPGVMYVIGGIGARGSLTAATIGLLIDEQVNQGIWTPLAPLPEPRAGHTSTSWRGNVFVVGGFDRDTFARREVYYARVTNTGSLNGWFIGPDLPEGRAFASSAVIGERLFVFGGESGPVTLDQPDPVGIEPDVFSIGISPSTGAFTESEWTVETPLPVGRSRHSALWLDDRLLVVGGHTPTPTDESLWISVEDGSLITEPTGANAIAPNDVLAEIAAVVTLDTSLVPRVLLVSGALSGRGSSISRRF